MTDYRKKYKSKPYNPHKKRKQNPTSFGLKDFFLVQLTICAILALGFFVVSFTDTTLSYTLRGHLSAITQNDELILPPLNAVYTQEPLPVGDFILDDNTQNAIEEDNR